MHCKDKQVRVIAAEMVQTVTSPACNAGRQMTLRAPYINNRINPAQFSRAALNLVAKLPKTENPCGLITYGARLVSNEKQLVSKIDYQWSDAQSLFGRYMLTVPTQPQAYSFEEGWTRHQKESPKVL